MRWQDPKSTRRAMPAAWGPQGATHMARGRGPVPKEIPEPHEVLRRDLQVTGVPAGDRLADARKLGSAACPSGIRGCPQRHRHLPGQRVSLPWPGL